MIEIYNLRYFMELRGGGDVWKLVGDAPGHPNAIEGKICPSTPVSLDKENKIFTTYSGRQYKIMSFGENDAEVLAQIEQDIVNGGYEVH